MSVFRFLIRVIRVIRKIRNSMFFSGMAISARVQENGYEVFTKYPYHFL